MGFADLHIHTFYSYDGTASVSDVLGRAKQIGLDVIAITDHDEINGSLKALRNHEVAQTLIGIETFNATALDKMSNQYASILGEHLKIAKLGNSDAHILKTIGMGMTEFKGHTADDLLKAIRKGETTIHKKKQWTSVRILGSWAANYIGSAFTRLANVA